MSHVVHILVTLGFSIRPLPRVTRVPRVTNEGVTVLMTPPVVVQSVGERDVGELRRMITGP